MVRLGSLLVALCIAPPGVAAGSNDSPLAAGVRLYEAGDFGRAQATLAPLADRARSSDADRIQAAIYLGACQFALGDRLGATKTLASLARRHPSARLDPAIFAPDLVAFAEGVRTEELKTVEIAATTPGPAAPASLVAPEVVEPARSGTGRGRAWIPAVAGVVLAGAGGALLGLSHVTADGILNDKLPIRTVGDLDRTLAAGRDQQTAGAVLLAAGGVALVAAGAMFAFGGSSTPTRVTLAVGPGGAGVAIAGELP